MIEVRCASFLTDEGDVLAAADVAYASSICFTDTVLDALGTRARKMRRGARFITLKRWADPEGLWEVVSRGWYQMSWGKSSVFVLCKVK